MHFVPLRIDYAEQGGWITFRWDLESQAGLLRLRAGFATADVLRAALATPWVRHHNGALTLDFAVGCQRLADAVQEILDYFDEPHCPAPRLIEIQRAVEAAWNADSPLPPIPPEACAWLDLSLRLELAELARDAADVWSGDVLEIDLATVRARKLKELFARYTLPAASGPKLAPSQRTRTSDWDGAKTA